MAEKKALNKDFLKINQDAINDDMSRHASDLYTFGVKTTKIKEKIEELEIKLDRIKSKFATTERAKYRRTKIDLSETALRDIIKCQPEVQELEDSITKYKNLYRLAELKYKTLKVKGEMMVNISHNIREEFKKSHTPKT